ncbi:YbjN domain-containing protein [Microscilla marina]|uniref:Uncharacterized protein n=1 Tax=Microscilla marina ATCC 23134 TaxID=313606 RepID=A1ZD11_MICM2|nr:YbjN domain-containing protein [Microscilla marina]EAY31550.1 hypothetical protein M23134_05056 [Microscilla marina ATCC 23134]
MKNNLKYYYGIVENCIHRLGVDPVNCRSKDTEGHWDLKRGDITVWIDVWHIDREKRAYIQVVAPIMEVPIYRIPEFYEDLLRINDQLFGVAFTLYHSWTCLKVIREVEGLDDEEAYNMITRVGNYGIEYLRKLLKKYGNRGQGLDKQEGLTPLN